MHPKIIADRVSRYDGSRIAREHNQHLDEKLRSLDGLKSFARPEPVKVPRRKPGAFHLGPRKLQE
ncbi:hypothetical protein [Bradyrhizobium sp. USDA 4473]